MDVLLSVMMVAVVTLGRAGAGGGVGDGVVCCSACEVGTRARDGGQGLRVDGCGRALAEALGVVEDGKGAAEGAAAAHATRTLW